jgi:hypothetical protein
MRVLRVDDLMPHVPRAYPSGHGLVIAVDLPARDRALATVVTARARDHDLAIAAMDRGLVIVVAGALVAVDADRVAARFARSVSIM